MSVVDRVALEASPVADLHAIASELSIDGYRRLRRADLIDAILQKQAGEAAVEEAESDGGEPEGAEPEADAAEAAESADAEEPEGDQDESVVVVDDGPSGSVVSAEELTDAVADALRVHDGRGTPRRRRGRRGGRGRTAGLEAESAGESSALEPEGEPAARDSGEEDHDQAAAPADEVSERDRGCQREDDEQAVSGVVELLPGGAAFLRLNPPDPSDDDVYISAAQVKRCELISGDEVAGPRRAPRRSERFASLVRVDTINGRPASEVADSAHFDELPAAFPNERLELGSSDPTLEAIDLAVPLGKGSRVTIIGQPRAGKSFTLRALASALAQRGGAELLVVLAGVRPEEIADWSVDGLAPEAALSLAASADAQGQIVEQVLDHARRLAARGADAVVLIDTLAWIAPSAARKALAAARNIVGGGSLTVIATAPEEIGGETSVIALDVLRTSTGQFPSLDLVRSGTVRAELLVEETGAAAIAQRRGDAMGRMRA
jgi:transcription termination factor Rho